MPANTVAFALPTKLTLRASSFPRLFSGSSTRAARRSRRSRPGYRDSVAAAGVSRRHSRSPSPRALGGGGEGTAGAARGAAPWAGGRDKQTPQLTSGLRSGRGKESLGRCGHGSAGQPSVCFLFFCFFSKSNGFWGRHLFASFLPLQCGKTRRKEVPEKAVWSGQCGPAPHPLPGRRRLCPLCSAQM